MNNLPRITMRLVDGGWLVSCSCGWESFQSRRPRADRAAREHEKTHTTRGWRP